MPRDARALPRSASAEQPAQGVALVEGRIVPVSEARVPLLDWGFLRSDACQDTVSVWRGRFFCLEEHIARFFLSCENLRLACPYSETELGEALKELVRASGFRDAYVQMIATRGRPEPGSRDLRTCRNSFLAFCLPYIHIAPDSGRGALDAIVSERPRIASRSVPSAIKNYHWIDFELGLFEAYERGGNTVILSDGEGALTEGPGFNLFLCKDGALATPDANVLKGITRSVVLELARDLNIPALERRVSASELEEADEVFATSTAGGIMAIRSINLRRLPGVPGPVTQDLQAAYWERREKGWRGTPVEPELEAAS